MGVGGKEETSTNCYEFYWFWGVGGKGGNFYELQRNSTNSTGFGVRGKEKASTSFYEFYWFWGVGGKEETSTKFYDFYWFWWEEGKGGDFLLQH